MWFLASFLAPFGPWEKWLLAEVEDWSENFGKAARAPKLQILMKELLIELNVCTLQRFGREEWRWNVSRINKFKAAWTWIAENLSIIYKPTSYQNKSLRIRTYCNIEVATSNRYTQKKKLADPAKSIIHPVKPNCLKVLLNETENPSP